MSLRSFTIAALIVLCAQTTFAEKVKREKFGKFTPEELEMKVYDKDTTADAVVLYQYAEFSPTSGTYRYHQRIKVLKKTGTSHANMAFPGQVKSGVKAVAYNMEDGKLVPTKLPKESVFEERVVGSIYRTRIALPNVKVGTIIEVEYTRQGIPSSLEIQLYIPVIYSAAILPKHPNVDYNIKEIGALGAVYAKDDTWIYKDIPAFVGEYYMISDRDYRVRMEMEVTSYNYSNRNYAVMGFFANSWNAVTKYFNDNEYLGKKYRDFNFHLNGLTDSIKKVGGSDEDMAKLAFDAMKRIKWNGQEACYLSQELSQTYQLRSGNSADINSSLMVVLRKLNLKAYPVLLSTRTNGKISRYSPTIDKLNYMIVGVDLPSGTKYLDATELDATFGLLPSRINGCLGHPIDDSKKECSVLIEPQKSDKRSSVTEFTLDPSGKIVGKVTINRDDYNAIDFKKFLRSKTDHDTYIQELESANQGWYIDKFNFVNLNDPYKPFISEYDVSYSSSLGGTEMVTFNPFVFVKPTFNPFVRETRKYPISYPQPIEHAYTVIINIPEGYQFSEIPKNGEFVNRDKTMKFEYKALRVGSKVTINAKFTVNKLQYETVEYFSIRDLFDKMMQKFNESVIIKKV